MLSIEVVTLAVVGIILFLSRKLIFGYRLTGNTIDVLGMPGVHDAVLANHTNKELVTKLMENFLFLTRSVPIVILIMISSLAFMYFQVVSQEASLDLTTSTAILISIGLTWMITYNPAPDWLYELQLIVLLTRSELDLEVVTASLADIDRKIEKLTETATADQSSELNMLKAQSLMLAGLLFEISATIIDLEHQQFELRQESKE